MNSNLISMYQSNMVWYNKYIKQNKQHSKQTEKIKCIKFMVKIQNLIILKIFRNLGNMKI